jgi:hypothetical protein
VDDLEELLAHHLNMPFPASVVKGLDYGSVDPVMIGADIYGWAVAVRSGSKLSQDDRKRLIAARDHLTLSIDLFPDNARPYYETVLELATVALAACEQ